ncbi:MAG: ABC transporter [Flavobacteriales bacterium]|nr:ABC transporter [Flavobacteriales bacterium]
MNDLFYLNKFFLKHKNLFILGAIFIFISNFFALYPAEFVRKAFDSISHNIQSGTNNKSIYILTKYSFLIILFAIIKGVFMYLMRQTIIVMSRKIECDLKNEIYIQYQKLSLDFYKKNKIGDLMNRISEDVSRVRMYLGPVIMYSINIIFLFSLVLSKMFLISKTLSLYVLIPLPLLAITVYYVSNKINSNSELVQKQLSNITTISQEVFSGIKIIKSFTNEKSVFNNFLANCKDYTKKQLSLIKIEAFFLPLIVTLIGTSTILTIYIGGLESFKGKITTGNIAEFIIYVNMLAWPVASVGWVTSIIQRAAASQSRINSFLLLKPKITDNKKNKPFINGDIVFDKVSLIYENTNIKAIKNISFSIKKRTSLGIFGKTGSGKSSVANLICRLYDSSNGDIFINNINIKNIKLSSLRQSIGYVPQDNYLFSTSILNNIIFSNYKKNSQKINKTIKQVEMMEEINNFQKGLNTIIGERGVQLSGGQRQRLGIARSIYKDSEILIFDDCLSAVDTNKENKIIKNIKKLSQEKTSIIISHRISSLQHCDKIIVLDKGQIVEKGNHEQLINKNGFYSEIYLSQMKKEID